MADMVPAPSNPQDDWKLWLAVSPATWLMPILFAVVAIALIVHSYVWDDFGIAGPVAVEEAAE